MNYAQQAIADMPRDRLVREAIRAHEALMRYGRHDPTCPADGNDEVEATGNCDCGLDAATYSPFVPEPAKDRCGYVPPTNPNPPPGPAPVPRIPCVLVEGHHGPHKCWPFWA